MKIKSFETGIAHGTKESFNNLDGQMNEFLNRLGAMHQVVIQSVQDTVHYIKQDYIIARTVVYYLK